MNSVLIKPQGLTYPNGKPKNHLKCIKHYKRAFKTFEAAENSARIIRAREHLNYLNSLMKVYWEPHCGVYHLGHGREEFIEVDITEEHISQSYLGNQCPVEIAISEKLPGKKIEVDQFGVTIDGERFLQNQNFYNYVQDTDFSFEPIPDKLVIRILKEK